MISNSNNSSMIYYNNNNNNNNNQKLILKLKLIKIKENINDDLYIAKKKTLETLENSKSKKE